MPCYRNFKTNVDVISICCGSLQGPGPRVYRWHRGGGAIVQEGTTVFQIENPRSNDGQLDSC